MVPLPSTLVVPQCVHSCCFAVHSSPLLAFGQSARKAARFTPSSRASESELRRSNKFKRFLPNKKRRGLSLSSSPLSLRSLSLSPPPPPPLLFLSLSVVSLCSLSPHAMHGPGSSLLSVRVRVPVLRPELSYLGNEIASQVLEREFCFVGFVRRRAFHFLFVLVSFRLARVAPRAAILYAERILHSPCSVQIETAPNRAWSGSRPILGLCLLWCLFVPVCCERGLSLEF